MILSTKMIIIKLELFYKFMHNKEKSKARRNYEWIIKRE